MSCQEILLNGLIGLITGLVSGGISGYIVYLLTKKKERKVEAYHFCRNFLFSALQNCEMYIPTQILHYTSIINKDVNSPWRVEIQSILDIINPYGHEDKEFTDEEAKLTQNVLNALNELDKWKKKHHLP